MRAGAVEAFESYIAADAWICDPAVSYFIYVHLKRS